MMRIKYIIIGFLALNLIPYLNSVQTPTNNSQPPNNSLGFKIGNVKTYKICSFDENLARKYLGVPYISIFLGSRAYIGAYRFILINNINYVDDLVSLSDNQTCDGWIVNISSWEWLTKEDWENRWGNPDKIYDDLKIYENPKDLGKDFYNIEEMSDTEKYVYDYLNFPYAVPMPVNEYLNQIDWAPNWTIDGKKVSIKFQESQGKFVEKVHYFDNHGFLKRTLLLTDNGETIYECCLEDEFKPIFILLIITGIAILCIVGIIYIFIKKVKL